MSGRRCKDCDAEGVGTDRPAAHPGPRCATHWRAEKRRRAEAAHARHVEAAYSITNQQYGELLEAQGGVCAICRVARGVARRLAVEHNHETGEVRGLCCYNCNYLLLGRYSVAALKRAIEYLEDPPARRVLGNTTSTTGATLSPGLDVQGGG